MSPNHLLRAGWRIPSGATRRGAAWLGAGAAIALALSACGSGSTAAADISVTTGACGGHWQLARPGWHTFTVRNDATQAATVNLIDPADKAVYGQIEALGPGTTRPMTVNVGSGRYAFQCLLEDQDPFNGPTVRIRGHARGAPAILPVTAQDMVAPAAEYHKYVTAGLVVLATQVHQLDADIGGGKLGQARKDWLPAHLTYERLGAAYGTFDTFDGEINGTTAGLPKGVSDPDFTGFFRLEYGLWHGQSVGELRGPADALRKSVLGLQKAFPAMEVDLLDLGLRTHEILENALQFQLTGTDDYGSGTTLATTEANIVGTRELLTILHPLLTARYQGLPQVSFWLDRLSKLLDAQHHADGSWTPVHDLSTAARERINAAASQSLQLLAPIAVITEPRRD
jgi:iron uptake system component EfeO